MREFQPHEAGGKRPNTGGKYNTTPKPKGFVPHKSSNRDTDKWPRLLSLDSLISNNSTNQLVPHWQTRFDDPFIKPVDSTPNVIKRLLCYLHINLLFRL